MHTNPRSENIVVLENGCASHNITHGIGNAFFRDGKYTLRKRTPADKDIAQIVYSKDEKNKGS